MADGGTIIRLLPSDVANQIAAGEVVERPAAALKELIENALDAGARRLDIEVVAGGTRLISVSDDGSGMSRDDALLCVERHATSKIRTAADLERVATLGFRGEALAAISSVARCRIRTRRPEDLAGTELLISGGKLQDVRDAGCPVGTSIEVRDLFFNLPARRKFLRSVATETAHIRQVFLSYALAYPDLAMKLASDDRCVHALSPGTAADRLRDLFGPEMLRQLRPIACDVEGLSVSGFAGVPALHRGDAGEIYTFINRRPASAGVLHRAIREAYRTLLPSDRYPVLFLMIAMDPALVDVNVHPAKREVRFRNGALVRDVVIQALRRALAHDPGEPPAKGRPFAAPPVPVASHQPLAISDLPVAPAFQYPRMPMTPPEPPAPPPAASNGTGAPERAPTPSHSVERSPWAWCRIIGQIGGLYVLLETEEGLVVMDPHAAHERVLFERLTAAARVGPVESQGLLTPESVELSSREAMVIRRNMERLRALGFGVADFGGNAFMVDALPTCLSDARAAAVLADIARELDQAGAGADAARLKEEAIAAAACKAAVRSRDRLSVKAIEQLVVDLASCEMPYTCPHGRPTLIFTSFRELARRFGRE